MAPSLVEGEIFLLKGDKGYHFEDPALENLTLAEKHLLRMGPGNAGKIQAFLGDFGKVLGFSRFLA